MTNGGAAGDSDLRRCAHGVGATRRLYEPAARQRHEGADRRTLTPQANSRPGGTASRSVAGVQAAGLFDANLDLARACRDHPFVQRIASGPLDRASFCSFIAQDATFLDAFVRAYALGAAKAPDGETMTAFKTLLDGGFDELELHRGCAARWGVDLAPEPAPATAAYTDSLLWVAALEPVGHLCAAMTPCGSTPGWGERWHR